MAEGFSRWKKHFEAGAIKYTKDSGFVRSGGGSRFFLANVLNVFLSSCSVRLLQVPTLIVDDAYRLTGTPEREALLAYFQDTAEDWADTGLAKVVFVPSTGAAGLLLFSSARSLFFPLFPAFSLRLFHSA